MSRPFRTAILITLVLILNVIPTAILNAQSITDNKQRIQETLNSAGPNRSELESALSQIENEFLAGMEFLIAYMPAVDAESLGAEFLLEHVRGAYVAWQQAPWKNQITEELFLNYVLPYANVSERRDAWRDDFRKRFLPKIESAKTPSEAAVKLNQTIFDATRVKYSRKRKRADQSPYESIELGTASCTGLSIMLIDACRSVGVPARFVGTPRWSDNSGNHSWVEVWDNGWHFTGAAEPTDNELNQAWFGDRAAMAKMNDPMHAIYATSYRNTGIEFPLVWSHKFSPVWATNETERYVHESVEMDGDHVLIRLLIVDNATSERVAADVIVKDSNGTAVFEGTSNDESTDGNDHLKIRLKTNSHYQVEFRFGDSTGKEDIHSGTSSKTVSLSLNKSKNVGVKTAGDSNNTNQRLTKGQADSVADQIWKNKLAEITDDRIDETDRKVIVLEQFNDLQMKYETRVFGEKPPGGHALFISMHGGGEAPAEVNEQQWQNQIGLYKPKEGVYLAPRAPTDTWNLWHQTHVDAFFDRIIENFVVTGRVDPNRVYLMGYSAGGDGVFQLAPRMADRFAAAAMMAGHPNETKADGLRNLPFAIYMGGKDAAFERNKTATRWKQDLEKLEASDPSGFEHSVTIYPNKGHWMDGEDASALDWMTKYERNVWPKKIVWYQDDVTHERFYWLAVPPGKAKERTTISAEVDGQTIHIKSNDVPGIRIWLSDRIINLDKPIDLLINGNRRTTNVNRSTESLHASLESRIDREMMAPAYIDVVAD